jgi:antitoxin HigA-1
MKMHNSSHPGELLRTWIEGGNLTVTLLADHIGVTRATLSRIINGHAGVTAEMDCACIKRSPRARVCGLTCKCNVLAGRRNPRRGQSSDPRFVCVELCRLTKAVQLPKSVAQLWEYNYPF